MESPSKMFPLDQVFLKLSIACLDLSSLYMLMTFHHTAPLPRIFFMQTPQISSIFFNLNFFILSTVPIFDAFISIVPILEKGHIVNLLP